MYLNEELRQVLENSVLKMVKDMGGNVSFAELEKIEGFKGNYSLEIVGFSNMFLWFEMSKEAVAAIDGLLSSKKLEISEASVFTYLMDGRAVDVPVAKSAMNYKKPRWVPVVFNSPKK